MMQNNEGIKGFFKLKKKKKLKNHFQETSKICNVTFLNYILYFAKKRL